MNTPGGSDVKVDLVSDCDVEFEITFDTVTEPGETSVNCVDCGTVTPPPLEVTTSCAYSCYDITSTADYSDSASVEVCIDYGTIPDCPPGGKDEHKLKMFHDPGSGSEGDLSI